MDRYIDALGKELKTRLNPPISPFSKGGSRGIFSFEKGVSPPETFASLQTVYIGGGTPTALNESQLERLFNLVKGVLGAGQPKEYTIEANPGTLSPKKVRLMRDNGINRVSLGVQSFSEKGLKILGRIHSPIEAEEGYYMLREAGFSNINLDLIFGWPGQSASGGEGWKQDLQKVIELGPDHVSTYCLTIERGTPLHRDLRKGRLPTPDETLQLKMYKSTLRLLTRAGYKHYEISNFALKGKECLHNINYWKNGTYLGIGVGAFSYVNGRRFSNVKDVQRYINKVTSGERPISFAEYLPPERRAVETLIMALRLRRGITEKEFCRSTGYSFKELHGPSIEKLSHLGLLSLTGDRLHLTQKGLFLANQVMVEFV